MTQGIGQYYGGLGFEEPPAKRQQLDHGQANQFYGNLPPLSEFQPTSQSYDFLGDEFESYQEASWTGFSQGPQNNDVAFSESFVRGLDQGPIDNFDPSSEHNAFLGDSGYISPGQEWGYDNEIQQPMPISSANVIEEVHEEPLPCAPDEQCFGMVRPHLSL
jgi:hypothetical protein